MQIFSFGWVLASDGETQPSLVLPKKTKNQTTTDWWEGWQHYFSSDEATIVIDESSADDEFEPRDSDLDISVKGRGGEAALFVMIEGEFKRPLWNLLFGDHSIAGEDAQNENFQIELELTGKETPVLLRAIGPQGEVKEYHWTVRYEQWGRFKKAITNEKPYEGPRPLFVTSLIGSSIRYEETGTDIYSMTALALKVAYIRQIFNKSWELGGDLYATVFPLSKSSSSISMRFIEANMRFGWVLPFLKYPWRLKLALGFYFSNTLVTNDSFGYTPILFPQVYPVIQKFFSPKDMAYFYLKYVPTKEGLSFFSFRERAIAAGLGWYRFLSNKKAIILSLDYSNLVFNVSDSVAVNSTNISFSIGYGI